MAGDQIDVVTIRRTYNAALGERTHPVALGPLGAEFISERGSASGWDALHSSALPRRTLVLLPPPDVHVPELVAARGWLVPPCHPETSAPLCAEAIPAGVLLESYLASVETAREEWRCV
ncbi:hypothetical protein [Streptomyces sp. NPDC001508]|uniref:hypothetical protein n=1 Tax=Streptomyces sp. NPDC001508 TaxID=3154656 RepID=UPI0033295C7A